MILNKLVEYEKKLDRIPYSTILSIVSKIDLKDLIGTKIIRNSIIYRARPSVSKEFNNIKEISYRKNPNDHGRAHHPGFPIFYGSFKSSHQDEPIITCSSESIEILKNKITNEGDAELTIGQWLVKDDMPVISIIYNKEFLLKNRNFLGLYELFISHNKNRKKSIEIMEFVSDQFAKSVEDGQDYNYKISAAFSEYFLKKNTYEDKVGALIYPSVGLEGEGYNIAIMPYYLKKYLKPIKVATVHLYIKNNHVVSDWLKYSDVELSTGNFHLMKSKDKNSNKGREECLKSLNRFILKDSNRTK